MAALHMSNSKLTSFLDSKFSQSKRVSLGSLVKKFRTGDIMPKGTLVLVASGDRRLRLRILQQDTPHKHFSEPLATNVFATEHKVTSSYLLWYLSREPVTSYLLEHATGAVFVRIPRDVLHSLPVPLPTSVRKVQPVEEFAVTKADNEFSKLIEDLHTDYILNVEKKRYRTAVILAGIICEVILYQSLVEHGVSQGLLKKDHNLAFGKLLDYIRLLKIDQAPGYPISQLLQVQKNRNHAVHAGLLLKAEGELQSDALECFDPIVRYFGL